MKVFVNIEFIIAASVIGLLLLWILYIIIKDYIIYLWKTRVKGYKYYMGELSMEKEWGYFKSDEEALETWRRKYFITRLYPNKEKLKPKKDDSTRTNQEA